MREHIGPGLLGVERIVVVEPAALQLRADTGHGMHPFQQREVALESDAVAELTVVRAVRKGRAGSGSDRDFPVVPESVGNEAGPARPLRGFLRPGGGYERQEQDRRIDFFHNRFIIKYVILLSANSVLICPKTRKAANRRQKRPETNISGLFTKTSLRAGIIRTWNSRTTCT